MKPTKAKSITSVSAVMRRLQVNPFQKMAEMALADETPIHTRARLWMELAKYCEPQLRAVDVKSSQLELDFPAVITQVRKEIFGLDD